jgi:hypothetical protein
VTPADPLPLPPLAGGADLLGSVLLAGYVAAALAGLARGRGVAAARMAVADGVVLALSLKTAAALMKALELQSWDQIGLFATVLALRTLLKRVFAWERSRIAAPGDPARRLPHIPHSPVAESPEGR